MNLSQVARRMGVDRQTVVAAIARGELRAEQVRMGNQILWSVREEDYAEWAQFRKAQTRRFDRTAKGENDDAC